MTDMPNYPYATFLNVYYPPLEVVDVPARWVFLKKYQPKYHFDMAGMEKDILAMKEPVFAVRPRLVFGLYEKNFMGSATRWKFKSR